MFALVDCNNFYASCERVFRPDLNNRPIVVLSNNDGCVIARSNEAKKLGIPMGAPAFQYEKIFKEFGVEVFSANFALYGDMSNRVMTILADFSPEIEIYSIDESFIKFSGSAILRLNDIGLEMRRRVLKWTGIPISVGFANTKSLAKVANKIAKKFPEQTKNIYIIDSEEKRVKALKWLKIEDVWGIGRQYSKLLQKMDVHTAYDFTQLNDEWVKKRMTIIGLRLKRDLQGIPTLDLEQIQSKKSIATTRSFDEECVEFEQLAERVTTFAVSCAEKLRKQQSCCNAIMVFVLTNRHKKEAPQYNKNIVMWLPFATNSSLELAKFAREALSQIYKEGYRYKKAGVIALDIIPENRVQQTLFLNRDERHINLMKAIDWLNSQYGQQTIRLASQHPKGILKMRREKLSPRYTTNLDDIITINLE